MAVEAAMANQEALKSAIGDGDTPPQISVLNVVQLQTRGMLQAKTIQAVKNHMLTGSLPGAVLLLYPLIPSTAYSTKRVLVGQSVADDAGGDDDDDGQSSSDSDSKSATGDIADDLGDDKSEIKSQSVSHLSKWAKQAALANDWFMIDDEVGRHNTAKYFARPITFAHVDNGKGKRAEKALLLIPRPDYRNPLASGSAPASENTDAIFEKSILVRDGVYTEVEETEQYINVSRRIAMHARKTQPGHW